jgi:uncharacterized membrane protein
MARELGGGRLAQGAAALSVAVSPLPLFEGTEFQYTTFDYLWCVTTAYFVIRLMKTKNLRWWLAMGATLELGLMSKYTIVFLAAGGGAAADAEPPLSCERLAVGRSGRGGRGLSA